MKTARLAKIKRLKPDLIPPRGSKPVGLHSDGRMIYEMERRDHEKSKKNRVVVKGADGAPLMRKDAFGNQYPVMRIEPVSYMARFVLERSPSGAVFIQEHFEQSKDEKSADQVAKMRNEFSDLLAKTAVERGLTAEQMIARLLDPIRDAGPGQVLIEENYPIHRGGKAWILSNGETYYGNRRGAQTAESKASGKKFDEVPEVEVTPEAEEPVALAQEH